MNEYSGLFGGFTGQTTVVNSNKDRRLAGKKRRNARRQARRTASVLAGTGAATSPDVRSAPSQPVRVARYGLQELEGMSIMRLRILAKELGLKNYSKLRKDDLVEFVYRSEENLKS